MKPKSKILIIAGSDSSGGAGIQADIKTVTALGSYAMTAITAITAQNTTGVSSVVPLNPKEIEKQILFTSKDIKPDAIKIGMLHSSDVIFAVMRELIIAFGLFLFIEGILYALFPSKMKNMLKKIDLIKESQLRSGGLIFAIIGFLIIWYLKK